MNRHQAKTIALVPMPQYGYRAIAKIPEKRLYKFQLCPLFSYPDYGQIDPNGRWVVLSWLVGTGEILGVIGPYFDKEKADQALQTFYGKMETLAARVIPYRLE